MAEGSIDHEAVFQASSTATMILSPDLLVLDVNEAHLRVTGRSRDEVVGRSVFDVFEENPDDPEGGRRKLLDSWQRVVEEGVTDRMGVQRYDLADPSAPGGFEERYWSIVNAPLFDAEGRVVAVLNTAADVTRFRTDLLQAIAFYRDEAEDLDEDLSGLDQRFLASTRPDGITTRLYTDLASETDHLRTALRSRATIEQAKGAVMARYGCDAETAFAMMVDWSQQQNLKVRDIARALLERVVRSPDDGPSTDGAPAPRDGARDARHAEPASGSADGLAARIRRAPDWRDGDGTVRDQRSDGDHEPAR
jgi:PAS domain S-box-containing protein